MIVLSWGVVQGCFRKAQWVLLTKKRCRKWRRIFWFFFLNVRFYSTTHDMKGLGNQVTKIVSFPRESFKFINERHFLKNGATNDQMSSLLFFLLLFFSRPRPPHPLSHRRYAFPLWETTTIFLIVTFPL